jgi:putative serine protease PepD
MTATPLETPPQPTGHEPASQARPPDRRQPGWRLLTALLVLSALLGGLAATGLLAVTGVLPDAGTDPSVGTTAASTDSDVTGTATATSLDAAALYQQTAAGVVGISAAGRSSAQQSPFPQTPQGDATATGSGFVVSADGFIITAAHVVDGASSVTVTFQDGTEQEATVLGQDDSLDVAVLQVDPSGLDLQPLELGDSSAVSVGDAVAAIGDPFGYARSLSTGIVSGLDRTIQAANGFTVAGAIQTDTSLNPGNSGGPLLDAGGRVIGIVDQIATNGSAEQSSGVGFAVPINAIAEVLDQLQAGDTVSHAYLGIGTSEGDGGALIETVVQGTPADDAGLRAGDIVTELDGTAVNDSGDLVAAIADHAPGDRVEVIVQRESQTITLTVTLGTQPDTAT